MPTYNTPQYTDLVGNPPTYAPVPSNERDGVLRIARFSINCVTALVNGDVVNLTVLPAGARFIGIVGTWESIGAAVTADIGDAGDADRLVAGLTGAGGFLTATGQKPVVLGRIDDARTDPREPAFGQGYKYSVPTAIKATFTTVTTGVANAQLEGYILYVVE